MSSNLTGRAIDLMGLHVPRFGESPLQGDCARLDSEGLHRRTYMIFGIISLAILIIGLVVFFIVKRKKPPVVVPPQPAKKDRFYGDEYYENFLRSVG